jgi:hypothetical protein
MTRDYPHIAECKTVITCTTSVECKIIITAMLTVMSGMNPHMISGNPGFGWVGLVWLVCRSGLY